MLAILSIFGLGFIGAAIKAGCEMRRAGRVTPGAPNGGQRTARPTLLRLNPRLLTPGRSSALQPSTFNLQP